jgi:mannose-6-phosphate isomerase
MEKVWGGRRLETVLGRELPEGLRIGESWEISFRPGEPTPVTGGRFDGARLDELAREHPEELLGVHVLEKHGATGPLLLKIIDAAEDLSIQVHPDESCARAHPPAEAKSEAWCVLAAEKGSRIVRGLMCRNRESLRMRIAEGDLVGCLRDVEVSPGDVIDLPAGTVHALGAGIMVAEIQQSSDTTYRLHDWGRVGLDGRPRELHVEQAIEAADLASRSPDKARGARRGSLRRVEVVRYVNGPRFVFERVSLKRRAHLASPRGRFSMLFGLAGSCELWSSGGGCGLRPGRSLLIPAAVRRITVAPDGAFEMLRFYVA